MKVSLNAIKKYIDIKDISVDEIAHRLTFAGVEVESVSPLASATNLTVGKVLTCENMPNSDHLHLTTVDAGKHGVLHIVCGAPNVKAGIKVIVALDGAKLPGGVIRNGKIRGYESQGMLCSLLELGVESKFLSEEQTKGIEILPDDAVVGDDNVLGLLGLDDVILDLKLLANRSDLYSVKNVAREIETLFDLKANIVDTKEQQNANLPFMVNSLTERCSQFSGRVVKNIKVKESPKWMKDILRSSGIRSINNIVDIGNYVMIITGQPLHMYDLDKLPKKELVVRDDYEGDFVALDEKTYKLQNGDVVITSNGEVMCLGGVMGSLACAVDENTKNVVIEAANFDFASVRRTSIRLNLVSDSSMRFVKGINPNQYVEVMNFTALLLKDLADASEVGEINTYLKNKYEPTIINTSTSYINARLGTSFSDDEIISSLRKAFIETKNDNGHLECVVPSHRIDITGPADLSEEVIRILGFENVKSELPSMQLSVGALDENLVKKNIVRDYLRGIGLDEQLSYTLVRKEEVESFKFINKNEYLKVMHPLTDEHEYIRINLLPSEMNLLTYNVNHSNNDLAFFEVSDVFAKNKKSIHLAIVLAGSDLRRHHLSGAKYDFYHMKGIVDGLLSLFDIDEKRATLVRADEEELHPGKSATLKVDGKVVATFGEVHPNVNKKYGLGNLNVVVLEADLTNLFAIRTSAKKMEQTSRFPTVTRDFAFVLSDKVSAREVVTEIKKINRELIKNVDIFDVYRGEHIEEGYYSLALSVAFSSLEKTLNEQDIALLQDAIIKQLKVKFNADLRK